MAKEMTNLPKKTPHSRHIRTHWRTVFTLWNLAVLSIWLVLPFLLAKSVRWPAGWLHVGVVAVGLTTESIVVARRNPGLWIRRKGIGLGTKNWDLVWNMAFWPLMASIAAVGGLQRGMDGTLFPVWIWPVGLLVVASGFILSAWAMGANPYFEGTVRIQTEVNHHVFEGGPYRHVRHPGYLGLVLWAMGTPLLLLSPWSVGPAVVTTAWIVLRTGLEDATLQKELPGYVEYTHRTRHRLLWRLW